MPKLFVSLSLVTTGVLFLFPGGRANCQDFKKARNTHTPPRSLFDMYGVHANTSIDMDWQNRFVKESVKESPAALPSAPLIATNTNVSGGPAGTEEMYVYRNGTDHCVSAAVYSSWSTVFDKTIVTGPGSKYLQIIYTTQANVNDGVDVDGLAFQCLVTQGSTTVSSSNTDTLPFLLARTTNGKGNSVVVTYSGYVAVDPSTSTHVLIQVTAGISGTLASACANNLILRY